MGDGAKALNAAGVGTDMIAAWVKGALMPVDKIEVHRRGLHHPAVSVFVTGPDGILIQQRAAGKYHSAGLWANTCCSHPHWGESAADCASRRLWQELGLRGLDLHPRGQVDYRADVGGGMVEHERVDVFVAGVAAAPKLAPDPAEVMAVRWISLASLQAELSATPALFTAWLRIYLADHATRIFGETGGQ